MFKKLWVRIQAPYSGWTFSHRFVVKIVVCLKRPKINEKEAGFKKEWCPNGPRRGEPLEKDMNISIIPLN